MRLDLLRTVPGLVGAVLAGPDGLPLETLGSGGDALAAELTSLRTGLERMGRRLGAGQVTRVAFTAERVEVVAVAGESFVLAAALQRGTDTRSAQQFLARLASELSDLPALEHA
ncbi:roadblock/LC7 domain-containing protein [Deinococcus aestuarii]|uniref:roadblock/LC7 domain-containing protein n=1 Tax=Deinococcus aestuarii TaxID=2774531 RepID=UPI001C0D8FDE